MNRILLSALALIGSSLSTSAQPAPASQPAAERRAPALIATDDPARKPLRVTNADVHVTVDGFLAETTMTLTFASDANRVLEGELVFPLPEGATVSGYGIDVNGQIVDGVAIEKLQARQIYEKEVHKGIDPGLMENVGGNNFRTRIYPIPPGGTRTVKVQYVSDLSQEGGKLIYRLPLDWANPRPGGHVRIDVDRAEAAVRASSGGPLDLEQRPPLYTADRAYKPGELPAEFIVSTPAAAESWVHVAAHSPWLRTPDEPADKLARVEHYFLISDAPPVEAKHTPRGLRPNHIGILWDASMSRQTADTAREIALLRRLLSDLGDVKVDLVVFRNVPEPARTFDVKGGNADALIAALKSVVYDGGTNLGALVMRKLASADGLTGDNYWLLFTDGNGDLGAELPPTPQMPVYPVSSDDRANHAALRFLAQESGGIYLNLRHGDASALEALEQPALRLIRVEFDKDQVTQVYPTGSQPALGRMSVAGRLLADEAKVTLHYGYGDREVATRTFTLRRADARKESLVPRQWAQMKVAELSIFPDRNHDALLAIGREFNLVTPVTSLLVLETADQYVQYRVVPPANRPEIYKEFADKIEQHHAQQAKTEQERIAHVLDMWNERVAWYDQKHEYAANFRFVENPAAQPALVAGENALPSAPAQEQGVPLTTGAQAPSGSVHGGGGNRGAARVPDFTDAPQMSLSGPSDADQEPAVGGGVFGRLSKKEAAKDGGSADDAEIAVKPWDPNVPYLLAMKKAGPAEAYAVYLEQRKSFADSPAFYLDCADYFFRAGQRDLGLRVLTNVAELRLEDARLLRILAHRLNQLGERELAIDLFEKILRLRPDEPQSSRDLALALSDRADDAARDPAHASLSAQADYDRALRLLNTVVTGAWDRFDGIQVVALMEANRVLERLRALPHIGRDLQVPLDSRLVRNLDLDVRVVMTWDTDNTDIDLWVTEPSGEKCFYGHNRTTIGGLLSKDFTDGYGPEEYCLHKLMPGQYKIQANFYGSRQQSLVGPTTVQATVITNFGRPNEKRQQLTLRLTDNKETVDVGTVTLEAPKP